jgi:hypothetical protein
LFFLFSILQHNSFCIHLLPYFFVLTRSARRY